MQTKLNFQGKFVLLEIGLCALAALISVAIAFIRSLKHIMQDHRQRTISKVRPATTTASFATGGDIIHLTEKTAIPGFVFFPESIDRG
jgi:hypothetical protein